jgi:ZIP family zinc transporter
MSPIVNVFLLSLVAGLGAGLGGLLAIIRKPGQRMFGFLMGFASGVMITLSFVELVNEAWRLSGYLVVTAGFGAGALFMFLIDFVTPHIRFGEREREGADARLFKTGVLVAIGITIHNLPEGAVVGAGYLHQPQFGAFIALAIALHNIPEGIATVLPLCQSGVCARNAFWVALLSGMVEPVGALIAALLLTSFHGLIPVALAFAAGVMVFLTLDELVPTAREHGHQHFTAIGIILGAVLTFLLSGTLGV